MFKNYFKGIDGIENYPLLLLVIFFIFFIGTAFYLWKVDRKHMREMSEMPLRDSIHENSTLN